ncbi:MAG: alpha/beta hydrolase [Candidatus Azobacteroides sp.]|nr:alpha/beta hydrolase [Candidatus Azobacteroides sp.]
MKTLKINLILFMLTYSAYHFSQVPIEIDLWENGAPQNSGITEKSETTDHIKTNITEAKLFVYSPTGNKKTDKTIIICPGGGYGMEAIFHEGRDFAAWLASEGITGIVLEYRLPNQHPEIPISDLQQAIRLVRQKGIGTGKTGVAGFSAGGHLAATAGTHFDSGKKEGNEIERQSCRPDFMVLFYPVITMEDQFTHKGSQENLLGKNPSQELIHFYSNEKQVTSQTPPAILFLSDDDKAVVPENSVSFYRALKENNIPASMYIFPTGGHGWGMNDSFSYKRMWQELLLDWLNNLNL